MTDQMDGSSSAGRWVLGLAAVAAFPALLLLPGAALGSEHPPAPALHFWSVSTAAFLCLVLSLVVVVVGCRRHQAEIALLGVGLTALSALSVVHGVTAPGYLYDPNAATITAATLALPAAGFAALPLLVASTAIGAAVMQRWKAWTLGSLAVVALVCVALLTRRNTAVPDATWFRVLVASASGLLVVYFAGRQLALFELGRRRASLVAAAGALVLGLAGVLGIIAAPYSPGWWAARAGDNAAVLAVGAALLIGYRQQLSVRDVLEPVVTRDPLVALELGLAPELHAFVAALDSKDPSTRAHVVRTGELAMRVGERAGLSARELRHVGLGGLLHDVGKLVVPSDILTKPDRLTEEEFAAMRTHAERGALLLERSRTLREVAPLVRSHHERHDGDGYPAGLAGADIPASVAIISAADAFDAMISTRHYRDGMSRDTVVTILREGAGTQWSPDAVAWLLAEVDSHGDEHRGEAAFDGVGRTALALTDIDSLVRPCLDALPPEVAAIWERDDAATKSSSDAAGVDAYRDLFESAPFAYFSVGADGRVAAANVRACELLGMPLEVLVGCPVVDLYADTAEGQGRAQQLFERFLAGSELREEELEMRRADGSPLWISLTATPILDGQGRVVASRSVALDITERRRMEEELRRLALRDPLTGLYNRRGFVLAGQAVIDDARSDHALPRLLFVDVDDLKSINDTYGHHVGDRALVDTAALLRSTLRDDDVVARLGGDEFCALVLADPDASDDYGVQPLATRIAEALARFNATARRPYRLSISVGLSAYSARSASIEAMLADADLVMYESKNRRPRQVGTAAR